MQNLTDIQYIKRLLGRHGFSFSKGLGQNFIIDPEVCPAIADSAGLTKTTGVLEIGAGIGVLTRELSMRSKKVVSLEVDARLIPVLAETMDGFHNTEILHADIMKTDINALIADSFSGCERLCVCANLPYYITSPIIMLLLEGKYPFQTMTFMVQKEAADRLCAQVGSRQAGAVTVAVDYYARAEKMFDVPKTAFLPSPKVDSSVINLTLRSEPEYRPENEEFFFRVVRAAFSQRRKTAANGISSMMDLPKQVVAEALRQIGLQENVRAEQLTMKELCELSRSLSALST